MRATLREVDNIAVGQGSLGHWIKCVQRKAILRRALLEASRICTAIAEAAEEDDVLIHFAGAALTEAGTKAQQSLEDLEAGKLAAPEDRVLSAPELLDLAFQDVRAAIPGIVQTGLTILAGRPKMGKSWLALCFALAVAAGGSALEAIPVESGEVLYLALEDGLRRLKKRLSRLLTAPPPPSLFIKTKWKALDHGGLRDLEKFTTAHPALKLLVIDTFKKVRPAQHRNANAYSEDYEALQPLQEFAMKYGIAILVVHHANKRAAKELDDAFDSISGSTGFTASADALLLLTRKRGEFDAVLHVVGRDIEEQELGLRVDQATNAWRLVGNADAVRMSDERVAIYKALLMNFDPMTPLEGRKEGQHGAEFSASITLQNA